MNTIINDRNEEYEFVQVPSIQSRLNDIFTYASSKLAPLLNVNTLDTWPPDMGLSTVSWFNPSTNRIGLNLSGGVLREDDVASDHMKLTRVEEKPPTF